MKSLNKSKASFLVFSDLHAHAFKYKASKVEWDKGAGFYNSRLVDTFDALYSMCDYALNNGINTILFAGDMFHVRGDINTIAGNMMHDFIHHCESHDIKLVMIPGNHDFADKEGIQHALQAFKHYPSVCLLDTVTSVHLGSFAVVSVPYVDSPDIARTRLSEAATLAGKVSDVPVVLLGHLGFQGAKVGSDYVLVSDNDIKSSDVNNGAFSACFFGHFHEHQQLFKNGWFVGALTQHNWGDVGGKRGFLHVEIGENKVKISRVETDAPKFLKLSDDSDFSKVREKDFVRVVTSNVNVGEVKSSLEKTLGTEIEVLHAPVQPTEVNLDLTSSFNPVAIVEDWTKLHDKNDSTKELGVKLVKQALQRLS